MGGLDDEIQTLIGRYAANALTLPSLDMFSNLSSDHAPELISHVLGEKPSLWANWRGRYGLSEEDQAKVWESVDPTQLQAPVSESGTAPASEADAQPEVVLRFKTWEGEVREVKAKIGQSLLEVGKAHDLPSLEGTCGGNLGEYSLARICPVSWEFSTKV